MRTLAENNLTFCSNNEKTYQENNIFLNLIQIIGKFDLVIREYF